MTTQILAIQPRVINFGTQTNADWLDGLVVWQAGQGAIVEGAANVGNGALTVAAVAPQTPLDAHMVVVTSVEGIARFTVTDPQGAVTGRGAVGTPLYAGGIALTLTEGSVPFAIGDAFAIGVLPVPVDITGLLFTMQVRLSPQSANVVLSASSIVPAGSEVPDTGPVPTIVLGTTGGQVAITVPRAMLTRDRFPPGAYVYDILATDPDADRTVPAFVGTITHVDGVTFLS